MGTPDLADVLAGIDRVSQPYGVQKMAKKLPAVEQIRWAGGFSGVETDRRIEYSDMRPRTKLVRPLDLRMHLLNRPSQLDHGFLKLDFSTICELSSFSPVRQAPQRTDEPLWKRCIRAAYRNLAKHLRNA